MPKDFIPSRESLLVPYTNNFAVKLTANPTLVGCTPAQATTFASLNTTWVTAYAVCQNPSTRSPEAIQIKDTAKAACVANLRLLAGIMQKFPGTTDALRVQYGLTVPAAKAPIGIPTGIPVLEITRRIGTTVYLRVHDGTAEQAKPAGVRGVQIYSFVGPVAPTDPRLYYNEGNSTRTEIELQFDSELAPGTVVWIVAAWANPRNQLGTGCQPVKAILAGGAMNMAA